MVVAAGVGEAGSAAATGTGLVAQLQAANAGVSLDSSNSMLSGLESYLRLVPGGGADAVPRITDARFGLSGYWLRFVTSNVEAGGALPTV